MNQFISTDLHRRATNELKSSISTPKEEEEEEKGTVKTNPSETEFEVITKLNSKAAEEIRKEDRDVD